MRKFYAVGIRALFGVLCLATCVNNYKYWLIERPQQQAALMRVASEATATLGMYQGYLEGTAAILKLQSISGQVTPKALGEGVTLVKELDARIREIERLYASVEKEARSKSLSLDLSFGRKTALRARTLLGDLSQEIVDIQWSAGVNALTIQLQQEEAVVTGVVDTLSHPPGDQVSQEDWSDVTREITHLLQQVKEKANDLDSGKFKPCEEHRQACREALQTLSKQATALRRKLEGIRRGSPTANNSTV
jgi:hypothetical protein